MGSGDPEVGVGRRVGNIRELPRPYPATVLSSFPGAITGSTRIHRILEEVGSIAFPGVFDTLSAKLAHRAGFPMAFVSGYSVSATAIPPYATVGWLARPVGSPAGSASGASSRVP
jgi:hypothetical protein